MRRATRIALAALPAFWLGGCNEWLTEPKAIASPNAPVTANPALLLNGIQAQVFVNLTGQLARLSALWTQQFEGVDRQFRSLYRLSITEDEVTNEFANVFGGGGLVDIRALQDSAAARNDQVLLGIGQVYEALVIGMAASLWGNIPYSETLSLETPNPALDPQPAVYAAMQALLDEAIQNLEAGAGLSIPGSTDLVFAGNADKWIEAAYTLKARYYMHWVDAQMAGGTFAQLAQVACGGNCIQKAIAAAELGLSPETAAFRTYHTATLGEENLWYQFMFRERTGYIAGGPAIISLLKERGDPRLAEFFASPTGSTVAADILAGTAVLNPTRRGSPGFDQPLLTWAEGQLYIAEAAYYAGNADLARQKLNLVRAAYGFAPISPTGPALLEEILEEQYIELFQNIEAKNLYERTCYPNLAPPTNASLTYIPGRFYYGVDERNANPNIPPPGAPLNTLGGNPDDPRSGTLFPGQAVFPGMALPGAGIACLGQDYPNVIALP